MSKSCSSCERENVPIYEGHGCLYCSHENKLKEKIKAHESSILFLKRELEEYEKYVGRSFFMRINGEGRMSYLPKGMKKCSHYNDLEHNYECSECFGRGYYEQ